VKICIECKHHESPERYMDHCLHPKMVREIDPVRGEPKPTHCETARNVVSACGPEAALWEAK